MSVQIWITSVRILTIVNIYAILDVWVEDYDDIRVKDLVDTR